MATRKLKWLNIGVGTLVGVMVWFIWQASQNISPETQSILARFLFSKILFGSSSAAETFFTQGGKDLTRTTHPIVFLPLSILASIAFSLLGPLQRFALWFLSAAIITIVAFVYFESARILIPYGAPFMLMCCSYVCGTLIYLESEKITRSRALAIDLQVQAEEERKRIATDLHDEVLPSLSRVMRLSDQLQEENSESETPQQIRTKLESIVMEMRRVINDLHPAVLENLGLAAALQHLVDRVSHETSIQTSFRDDTKGIALPPFHSLCIFRIAQEALNNVEKHSGASHLLLSLEKLQNSLVLRISDDGKGLAGPKPESHGLQNINHRSKLIGARAEWKAPENFSTGTMLVLTMPLDEIEPSKQIKSDLSKSQPTE